MSSSGMVIHKRMSFFSSLVWGCTTIVITAVLCATGLGVYGIHVVDQNADWVRELTTNVIDDVPELAQSLPTVANAVLGAHVPSYLDQLDVDVELSESIWGKAHVTPVIRITNNGPETVTWMTMRLVVRDDEGRIIAERVAHTATPIAIERECPGPLMPGGVRSITAGSFDSRSGLSAELEVTDIRLWVEQPPSAEHS